jgi:hypothetical protein
MRWPAAFTELLSLLRVVTLDFSALFAGSVFCVQINYYNRLYISVGTMALLVSVTTLLTYCCTPLRHRERRGANTFFRFVVSSSLG